MPNIGDQESLVPAFGALEAQRGAAGGVFGGVVYAEVDGVIGGEVAEEGVGGCRGEVLVLDEAVGGVWRGEEGEGREEVLGA